MIFRWIREAAERRRLRKRALFAYHDGRRTRRADPADIWRKLLNHPKMEFEMIEFAHQGREPETGIVISALHEIFAVEPFDYHTGRGLTSWEMLDLVDQFNTYLALLKKNTSPSRMPLLLLAYGSSDGQEVPAQATSSSVDSSSTKSESTTDDATAPSEPSPTP